MLEKINVQGIVTLAKQAGEAIMEIYQKDFEVEFKTDESPLTEAGQLALDKKWHSDSHSVRRGQGYPLRRAQKQGLLLAS
ncbi:MAG: hypothetical protein U9N57_05880 [Pseudomonadota bacterium]|nr:hypothetical protein [Pseudomonadota bacterium]